MKLVQIRDLSTNKIYTDLSELVLMMNKEGASDLMYCDMEGLFQSVEDPTRYLLVDECGGAEYLDPARFKVEKQIWDDPIWVPRMHHLANLFRTVKVRYSSRMDSRKLPFTKVTHEDLAYVREVQSTIRALHYEDTPLLFTHLQEHTLAGVKIYLERLERRLEQQAPE